jgi:hypothetical protein
MNFILSAVLLALGIHAQLTEAADKVRKIEVKKDQIAVVRTAPTIATIIQVPERPNSVVLGNQTAFQVEYLDTAVTVKSLVPRGRGNLYIYTDYRRYSVELVTGDETTADYIVYLSEPRTSPKTNSADNVNMRWKTISAKATADGFTLKAGRIGERIDGYYLIEFELEAKGISKIDPSWFWITQGGKVKPIQNLFLSSLIVPPSGRISGTFVLLRKEITERDPIRIEIRRKRILALSVPKVVLWK